MPKSVSKLLTVVVVLLWGVGVRVVAEHPISGRRRHTNDCLLTFVAIDENSRPAPVPGLELVTDEGKRRFEDGRRRREHREALEKELATD